MSTNQTATEPRHAMRSVWRFLVVVTTIAAMTVLAPSASAAQHDKAFHIEKLCGADGCTITRSSGGPLHKGTTITYAGDSFDALVATVHVDHGQATGDCDIAPVIAGTGPGTCVFTGGTGPLKAFSTTIAVNVLAFYADGTSLWTWDGMLPQNVAYHVEKLCDAAGSTCAITISDFGAMPVGTTITYSGNRLDHLTATIHVADGTATGICNIKPIFDGHHPRPGRCNFDKGTGSLEDLRVGLAVDMLAFYPDGTSLWSWDWTASR